MARLAPIFISHGSPMLALTDTPAHHFLAQLGEQMPRPSAILCVSAHWETPLPTASTAARPETIHDFSGFPEPLYRLRYPAPGAPELARRAAQLLQDASIEAHTDAGHGLDHGAWVPLMLMYPKADISVTQLSVQFPRDAAWHLTVGQALAPLCEEDVLVLGSGSAVHNLRALEFGAGERITPWAQEFETWLSDAIARGDGAALADYRRQAPHAARAHPRDEHILPLFVAAGAGLGRPGKLLHRSFEAGNLGMSAWAWP
jgi:4,5-DOPA dioxygenase extradiol